MSFLAYLSPISLLKSLSASSQRNATPLHLGSCRRERATLKSQGQNIPESVGTCHSQCVLCPSDPLCTFFRSRAVETECPIYQTVDELIKTYRLCPLRKSHHHQAEQLARLPSISCLLSSPQCREVCHWLNIFKRTDIIYYFPVLSLFLKNSSNGAFLVDRHYWWKKKTLLITYCAPVPLHCSHFI